MIYLALAAIIIINITIGYITGLKFLSSIFLGAIYFIVYTFPIVLLNNYLDEIIRKSSINSIDAKKYVFYWFFGLIIAEIFISLIF